MTKKDGVLTINQEAIIGTRLCSRRKYWGYFKILYLSDHPGYNISYCSHALDEYESIDVTNSYEKSYFCSEEKCKEPHSPAPDANGCFSVKLKYFMCEALWPNRLFTCYNSSVLPFFGATGT